MAKSKLKWEPPVDPVILKIRQATCNNTLLRIELSKREFSEEEILKILFNSTPEEIEGMLNEFGINRINI